MLTRMDIKCSSTRWLVRELAFLKGREPSITHGATGMTYGEAEAFIASVLATRTVAPRDRPERREWRGALERLTGNEPSQMVPRMQGQLVTLPPNLYEK